jgi:acetyl-CoA C-acetyltransferase
MEFLHDDRANPVIAWPLRLFDCSPISDGAAALLLVAEESGPHLQRRAAVHHWLGAGQRRGPPRPARPDDAARGAVGGCRRPTPWPVCRPADIDVAEVHDCFTIAEILATEDLGFFPAGEGWRAAEAGRTARTAERPVNTSGGLKSKGHPVGASGPAR